MIKIYLKQITQEAILELISSEEIPEMSKQWDFECYYLGLARAMRSLDRLITLNKQMPKDYVFQMLNFYIRFHTFPEYIEINDTELSYFKDYLKDELYREAVLLYQKSLSDAMPMDDFRD